MKQTQIRKSDKKVKPKDDNLDMRTPSGRKLPY